MKTAYALGMAGTLTAALTAAALILPASACATTVADDAPRILIVGDSITQGKAGDVTWRYHLWSAFGGNVDLVGPKTGQAVTGGGPDVSDQYPHEFDYDHASKWGMTLTFMDWPIAELVETYDPDVIVEQLGANDMAYDLQTPSSMVKGLGDFVAAARAVKPDVDIVLGQLSWTWTPDGQEFNPLLLSLAADLDTPGSRVTVALMPQMTPEEDTYDGMHPNAVGEVKIADAHVEALLSLGYGGDDAVGGQPVVTPPVPVLEVPGVPRRVRAVRLGARVKVTWRAGSNAASYVARCGQVKRATTGLAVRVKSPSDRCRVRAVNAAGVSPWVVAK